MHGCLVTESGGWAVDFIGRVEHMDEDMQAMLDEIERRRPAEAPPVRAEVGLSTIMVVHIFYCVYVG
jgi:hypothetical protein